MKCRVCGARMTDRVTDLPFRLGDTLIVIVRGTPVLECPQCRETEFEHAVMARVEQMLDSVDRAAELEVLHYAA